MKVWCNYNPCIVKFWDDVEKASIQTVRNLKVPCHDGKLMLIELPCDRSLSYPNPEVQQSLSGHSEITYGGVAPRTNCWGKARTYGAKLVENIVNGT